LGKRWRCKRISLAHQKERRIFVSVFFSKGFWLQRLVILVYQLDFEIVFQMGYGFLFGK